jgi:hypothetical protein
MLADAKNSISLDVATTRAGATTQAAQIHADALKNRPNGKPPLSPEEVKSKFGQDFLHKNVGATEDDVNGAWDTFNRFMGRGASTQPANRPTTDLRTGVDNQGAAPSVNSAQAVARPGPTTRPTAGPIVVNHPQLGPLTQTDLETTARKHGIAVEDVLNELGISPNQVR